jgi:hypothetical protein
MARGIFAIALCDIFSYIYRVKITLKAGLALLALALGTVSSFAATVTVNPSIDSLVTTGPSGNLSSSNYGAAGALAISAPGLSKGEFQSVMQFNLSTAKSTFDSLYGAGMWSLQSVTLQLNATPNNMTSFFNTTAAGSFNISLMQNNSWTEGGGTPAAPSATGINFNTLQGLINNSTDEALGTFSFGGNTTGFNTYTLTLSPTLFSDLNNGNNMTLRGYANDSVVSYLFNSENFNTAADRPLLTITVVPEPTTLAVSALGLIALGVWRRARSSRS